MSLQIEKLEKNMAKLTIEVSPEKLDDAIQKAYDRSKKKISIPGFRKGKVPRQIIEKYYGKEVFYEDAANILIPDAYEEALDECEETIVSTPDIEVTQIEAGSPFIFTATVALKPEVSLGLYKGVSVEKQDTAVTDEEIDAEIQKERENNARVMEVEDRPSENGDIVTIDFEGSIDGVPFDGGKGEDCPLTLGSGAFIPGFEEQLVGKNKDEKVSVNVTFPEDYHAENLKGKAAVFDVTIKEIKSKELPELDDEFASEVSEFETMAEYREDVKKQLAESKEKQARNAKETAVINAIIADSAMEIPDAMIATQQRQMADEFANRMEMQGLSLEQYFQFTGTTQEAFLEQIKPDALMRIQSRLVLEAIVKAEDIKPTDEEYDNEIAEMAKAYNMEPEKVKESIEKNEKAKEQFIQDIAVRKAVDFVVDNAKEKKTKKSKKEDKE